MCSVVGCDSWRRSAQRFKLPEDPERRLEWVQFLATVNKQRFKESSWTDITICSEHFKGDCFIYAAPTGTVLLTPSAVPSVCLQSESQEPQPDVERPKRVVSLLLQLPTITNCNSEPDTLVSPTQHITEMYYVLLLVNYKVILL
uniref:THAP domain-containing protein 1 n=1 Tax=Lates calcarifer TaxID=8187 RepID=A0A4W6DVV0_LATCA